MKTLRWLVALLPLLLGLASPGAEAACAITGVQSISVGSINAGTYTSDAVPPPATVAVTVIINITGNGAGSCRGSWGLVRPTAPATMARMPAATTTLPYSVSSSAGPVLSFGPQATTRVPIPDLAAPRGTSTVSFTALLTVTGTTPLTTPSAGTYFDQIALQVFDAQGSNSTLAGQIPLGVTANVTGACTLASPGSQSLNFAADVAGGIPKGATQSVRFNVNCTAPSRVKLTGTALTSTNTSPASAQFDSMINYKAVATFAGAAATLVTSGATPTTTTSTAASANPGSNLPVNVDVNLLANKPLLGGTTYSGTLRITVDPSL